MSYFYYQSKKIYYEEHGSGKSVLFLHGNTASSRMFELLLPLYAKFHVIFIDFLGHGRSDRLDRFPADLWIEEGRQTAALLRYLKLEQVNLVGSSGGAWAAINAALECPELIGKVVADSFDGRTLAPDFAQKLIEERANAKRDEMGIGFYQWCQGEDWESVVDNDTNALILCARERRPLFIKPLRELKVPLLLIGSEKDTMCRSDLLEEYRVIAAETGAQIKLFPEGGHPAILSNAERAAEVIDGFLSNS